MVNENVHDDTKLLGEVPTVKTIQFCLISIRTELLDVQPYKDEVIILTFLEDLYHNHANRYE